MNMRIDDLFPETVPARSKPRVLMHVSDAAGDGGKTICRMQCRKCEAETEWLEFRSVSEAKRGIPCPPCNADSERVQQ